MPFFEDKLSLIFTYLPLLESSPEHSCFLVYRHYWLLFYLISWSSFGEMLYLNLITFQVEVIHSFAFASRVELSKDGD